MLTVFSIYQYVKDKLEKTEKGTSAYDVLWDVYNYIQINMNSSYGMTSGEMTIQEKEVLEKFVNDLKKLAKEMEVNKNEPKISRGQKTQ